MCPYGRMSTIQGSGLEGRGFPCKQFWTTCTGNHYTSTVTIDTTTPGPLLLYARHSYNCCALPHEIINNNDIL